jgi:hypothetical protein
VLSNTILADCSSIELQALKQRLDRLEQLVLLIAQQGGAWKRSSGCCRRLRRKTGTARGPSRPEGSIFAIRECRMAWATVARSSSNPQLVLRPQDLVVLLRLALEPGPVPTYAALGAELGLTASETHAAVERAVAPSWRSRMRLASPQLFAPP